MIYGLHINDLIPFPTSYVISNAYRFNLGIRKWSRAADFILGTVERAISRRQSIDRLLDSANFELPHFVANMEAINEINIEAKKRRVKFFIVILPILVDVRAGTFKPIYDGIKKQFAESGIDYIDLSASLSDYKDSSLWILPYDQHPNEVANQIFAEHLSNYFISEIQP